MSKQLPRHLEFPGTGDQSAATVRASVLEVTRKPGLRLILNVLDAKQPFPHVGILLKDRELIGWITASAIERDTGDRYSYRAFYNLVFPGGTLGNTVYNNRHGFPDTPAWIEEIEAEEVNAPKRRKWHMATFRDLIGQAEGGPVEIYKTGFGFQLEMVRRFMDADSVRLSNTY